MKTAIALFLLFGSATAAHLRSHRKLVRPRDRSKIIDQQYIIVFDDTVDDVDSKVTSLMDGLSGCSVMYTYKDDLKGVTLKKLPDVLLSKILDDSQVVYVEPDQIVRAVGDQVDPPWGLDRIDEQSRPLNENFHYDYTGEGVTAFVVDTGIFTSHQDFDGRAQCGFSAFRYENCRDGQGHGTHVAGIVGGQIYGVAKNVDLVAVKVLDSTGSGSTSGVIAGIDYIRRQKLNDPSKPMVANMSLGGGSSTALDAAVDRAVAAGVFFAVAAGNSAIDACFTSPASAANAVTVASSNIRDTRSSFSNYGACVEIFAPGESITSTWSNGGTNTISGTSMASPHVAGAAALILEANPSYSPTQVWEAMEADAVRNVISSPGRNSPNLLLNIPTSGTEEGGGEDSGNGGDGEDSGNGGDTDINPQCRAFFRGCSGGSECCSNRCRFGICFFF